MDRFFNMDNKFFSAMSRLGDLMILNLLTMAFCIPVVTIGPALTAMFYVTLKMVRGEESYIVKGFWKSFKQNFLQGLIINALMLVALGLLILAYVIIRDGMTGRSAQVLFCLVTFVAVLYLMVFLYIYPVLSKFYNTVRNTFLNAFLMSIRHLPFTLLMAVVTAIPFVIFFFAPSGQIQAGVLLVGFMGGISGLGYINSFILVRIFDNYVPKEEQTSDMDFTVPEELSQAGEASGSGAKADVQAGAADGGPSLPEESSQGEP